MAAPHVVGGGCYSQYAHGGSHCALSLSTVSLSCMLLREAIADKWGHSSSHWSHHGLVQGTQYHTRYMGRVLRLHIEH